MNVEAKGSGSLSTQARPVFIVGPFPPPVHGMSAVNGAVRAQLGRSGITLVSINIAAPSLDRSLGTRLARLPNALRGMLRFGTRARRGDTLYMSVSGGFGQLYEVLFLLLARLHGMRIFLHHHSYAYLDQRKALSGVLVSIAGSDATHIALSDGMAAKLRRTYHQAERIVAISNAVLLFEEAGSSVTHHQALAKIGFLGNIGAEKGIFEFLAIAEKLEAIDIRVQVLLAGPFQDSKIERLVRERLTRLRSVVYVGPKYGEDKAAFFREIDVLLFPTRNDADPLTIHEAMMHGVPVIAYGRGAIGEIVFPGCGLVIDPAMDFVDRAVAQLQAWKESPQALQQASKAARERFLEICGENKERWESVRAEMCG
jgi:glycosyltransferase involved in cell wall biosynthesis